MASSRDLLSLAEDVVEGRRSFDNVVDQIAVAIPDDAARRRSVAELESLILGLTGVRAHARATKAVGDPPTPVAQPTNLVVEPRRVRPARRALDGFRGAAAGLAALVGVIVVAIVVAQLRPSTSIGGPSASAPALVSAAPSGSPSAGGSPTPAPSSTETAAPAHSPIPTLRPAPSGRAAANLAVLWSRTETSVTVWNWRPFDGRGIQQLFTLATWDIPFSPSYDLTVLASPDGQRFAIAEHAFGDPASHDRTRVVDAAGHVIWTSADGQPRTIDMAWSADGTMLALGAVPSPWTVLWFEADGSVRTQTFELPKDAAYRLLAIAASNFQLVGYETSGEAEFWRKPVIFDLPPENFAREDSFPSGLGRNSTGPVVQINAATGTVLAETGHQTASPAWILHDGITDTPLAIQPSSDVTWATPDTLAWLVTDPSSTSYHLRTRSLTASGDGNLVMTLLTDQKQSARLLAAESDVALLGSRPNQTYPGGDPGWPNVSAVDLQSGATENERAPSTDAGYWFGGWIGGATSGPVPSPVPSTTAQPMPTPTTRAPSSAVPSVAATSTPFDVDATAVPGAADVALWTASTTAGSIEVWRWSPSKGPSLEHWLDIDTWTNGAFHIDVVASPDGSRIAVTESGAPGSPLNRTRVFDKTGTLVWTSAPTVGDVVDVVWSPTSTKLALGAIPSPWTVVTFGANADITASTYDVSGGAGAYRLLGFGPDDKALIGYDSTGEAGFADQPVSLDIAHDDALAPVTPIATLPPGMSSNGTTSQNLARINPADGRALTIANSATNPTWVLRDARRDTPFAMQPLDVVWVDGSTIAVQSLASPPVPPCPGSAASPALQGYAGISTTTDPTVEPVEVVAYPAPWPDTVTRDFVGAHDGSVIVRVGPGRSCTGSPDPRSTRLLLMNVTTRHSVEAEPPAALGDDSVFEFAGWIAPEG